MPDFDIDFCQANRDRVIDYVKAKYGRDAVSQIATFGTMAAKAALRDVGRVLGMGYGHVDSIAKLVPAPPGKTVTLGARARAARPGRDLRAQGGARDRAARAGRRRGRRAARAGRAGRRHGAQRRHARRRRADRARQDHRLLPAVPAARQRQRGEPVRQGRRRGDRPGEVRLPRPGDADDPRAGQGLHRRAPPERAGLQLRRPAARRPGGLPAVLRRPDRGGVPVRKSAACRRMLRDAQAEPARGPDRAERDVPARARWTTSRASARASTAREAGRVPAPAARDGARARPTGSWSTRSR